MIHGGWMLMLLMMMGSNISLSRVFLVMMSLSRQVAVSGDDSKHDDDACDDHDNEDEDGSCWMDADEVDEDEDDGQQHYAVKGLPCDYFWPNHDVWPFDDVRLAG